MVIPHDKCDTCICKRMNLVVLEPKALKIKMSTLTSPRSIGGRLFSDRSKSFRRKKRLAFISKKEKHFFIEKKNTKTPNQKPKLGGLRSSSVVYASIRLLIHLDAF